ncbi:MAG TPA: murein biosynthesis integral membrane protein MurJ [bacterium]|nr:murein biosynthesis integral membrane protein MurJ [bacterium]
MKLDFLNHQTKRVGFAAVILAFSHLISRFLGLIRDWLLARSFGAGLELDVYFAAFKIPDFVYQIFILGGIVATFLPLFSEYFSKDSDGAWEFTSNTLNIFLVLLTSLSLILFIFTPYITKIIAPGFNDWQIDKTIFLTRLMLLSPIFFGLSSIFSSILQYFYRFLIYSFAPIVYNLSIIFGILFLSPRLGILGVALGVVVGAFSHFLIQIPSVINCGFRYKPILNFKDPKIKKVFLLMIPRAFGVSSMQINAIVINAIASTLVVGSISVFNFANNIRLFPIAIIGVSFATAVFPKLSRAWVENKKEKFINSFSLIFRQIIYLALPVVILMFILRNQLVNLILRHGQFSIEAAQLVSASVGLFCFGILFASLRPLFFRVFFSLKDTKTPTLLAVIFVIVNIVLSLVLTSALKPGSLEAAGLKDFLIKNFSLYQVNDISILGFPLAYLISLALEFCLFIVFLKKRLGDFGIKEILNSFLKSLVAGILMIFIVQFSLLQIGLIDSDLYQLVLISSIGFLAYIIITFIFGSVEIQSIKTLFFNKFSHKVDDYE